MIIHITDPAFEDLRKIYDYLFPLDPQAAIKRQNQILDTLNLLTTMPCMAPVEPLAEGLPETYRSLVILRRYKAVYYVQDQTVYVVSVWDCRQDPSAFRRSLVF